MSESAPHNPYAPPQSLPAPPDPVRRKRWLPLWCVVHLVVAPIAATAAAGFTGIGGMLVSGLLAIIAGASHAALVIPRDNPRRGLIIASLGLLQSCILASLSVWMFTLG